uniref:Putative secreted protein n=1 Tax=Rhipicephalus microplus TaxID=6941 RepID=A0A6G5A502_RHIMP
MTRRAPLLSCMTWLAVLNTHYTNAVSACEGRVQKLCVTGMNVLGRYENVFKLPHYAQPTLHILWQPQAPQFRYPFLSCTASAVPTV